MNEVRSASDREARRAERRAAGVIRGAKRRKLQKVPTARERGRAIGSISRSEIRTSSGAAAPRVPAPTPINPRKPSDARSAERRPRAGARGAEQPFSPLSSSAGRSPERARAEGRSPEACGTGNVRRTFSELERYQNLFDYLMIRAFLLFPQII